MAASPALTPTTFWLVTGLRPPNPIHGDWRDAVARRLLRQLDQEQPTAGTARAQAGLGLPDSCYWYVQRAEEDYGYVVFFYDDASAPWVGDTDAEGAACPFDTGGVWHDHMETDAPLPDEAARRAFVASHQRGLHVWRTEPGAWLGRHHERPMDYIAGRCPSRLPLPWLAPASVLNNSRCWTWEVRVRRERSHHVEPMRLFIASAERIDFLTWLRSHPRSRELVAWLSIPGRLITCDPSRETVFSRARQDLLDGWRTP